MAKLLLVGLGGFVGASLRFAVGDWVQRLAGEAYFPYGTLAVNLLGCLLIGLLTGLAETRNLFSPEARLLLLTGILGAFTTFSTFSYETSAFLRDGQFAPAFANVGVHIFLGLLAVWAGNTLSRLF